MDNTKIGVFDSGIGGVTVLKEIIKLLPNEDYIYYSDSKNNPYGDKTKEEIINICDDIVKKLIDKGCKTIVIACNTASAYASSYLREKYKNIPIIAIEPAYKMVYNYSFDDITLVMATKATIESEKFNFLYKKFNNHKTHLLACVGLADLIEAGNNQKVEEYLNDLLKPYVKKTKNVVLGCTHYPLVEDKIKEILGDVKIFNGAPKLAVHLKQILKKENLLSNNKGNIEFIDTSNSEYKKDRFFNILKK